MRLEIALKHVKSYIEGADVVDCMRGPENEFLVVLDLGEELHDVRIHVVGENELRSKQGIHTFPEDAADLEFRLDNAFETVERDLYNDIYIHVGGY